jgi:hypothetical protein
MDTATGPADHMAGDDGGAGLGTGSPDDSFESGVGVSVVSAETAALPQQNGAIREE